MKSDTRTYWQRIVTILTIGRILSYPVLGILILGLLSGLSARRGGQRVRWAYLWAGPIAGLGFLVAMKMHLYAYLWFIGPYVIVALTSTLEDPAIAPGRRLARASLASAILLVGFGATPLVRQSVLLASLEPDQTFDRNVQVIRHLIPRGSTVWTYDLWWGLGNDYLVFEHQVPASQWEKIDYVIANTDRPVGGDNSKPGQIDEYVNKNFFPIFDNRRTEPVKLLGIPLSRSFRGYGTLILGRRPPRASPVGLDMPGRAQPSG